MRNNKINNTYSLISFLIIFLYLAPYIFLGDSNYLTIWDSLDSEIVHYKILLNSGKLFSSNQTIVDQPLGGIPRGNFKSEFDALVLLNILLGEKWAYIFNRVLMSLVGFFGMKLFLNKHFLINDKDKIIITIVAICFSILPIWPWTGLSVSGMPLLFYAFFNIRKKNYRWTNWIILVLYAYYSSFVMCGLFLLIFLSIILVYDLLKKKNNLIFLAIVVLSVFYILFNYRLFLDFVLPSEYVTHRVDHLIINTDIKTAILRTLKIFVNGSPHALSLHGYVILPTVVLSAFFFSYSKTIKNRNNFFLLIFIIFLISFFYGFKHTGVFFTVSAKIKHFVPMQIDRFYFISPFLWMLVFALALSALKKFFSSYRIIILFIALFQILYSFKNHETYINFNKPTMKEFFATSQFKDIEKFINMPLKNYRIGSIGLHPSIALYNGFYTLDGYWANYPLNYKYTFREIIADELEKDQNLKYYYDNWGNRVYLFNSYTKRNMENKKGNEIIVSKIDFNWNVFFNLGGRYILSSVKIDSSLNPQMKFMKKFIDKDSAWDIYLYEIHLLK